MEQTLPRLTIFALITAIEADLRQILVDQVLPIKTIIDVFDDTARMKALERYKKDLQQSADDSDPFGLIDYFDLGQELQAIKKHEDTLQIELRNQIKRSYTILESLIPIRNRVMHVRPLEYSDYGKVVDAANQLSSKSKDTWKTLRETQYMLAKNPNYPVTIRLPTQIDDTNILNNLPQPDFDDTGFIGREDELAELRRALGGPYPIITVVGEGGLGKTALALKACYDLLDQPNMPFDAIIWITAKANRLTPTEIKSIEGAITNSLGIFEGALGELGRQQDGDAMTQLVQHLRNNKILLVIDNLETILDDHIRSFVRDVPNNSKVLFTSRIGLGAFDFPIKLAPLSKKQSTFYFRETAKVWGLRDLSALPNDAVTDYCNRLQHNPLFIKWFVQAIKANQRADKILANPKIILKFCMENVFDSLPSDAQNVARALTCVAGSHSVATIAFLTDIDSLRVQSALLTLLSSNLVTANRQSNADAEETYTLSTLSRMYIQNFLVPPKEDQQKYIRKQNELRSAKEEFAAQINRNVFDFNYVSARSKEDYIVARLLVKAIEAIRKLDYEIADERLRQASDLSPNYFEVRRVEAMLHVERSNFVGAEAAYEAAISLAPERAPLRLWYAGFLARYLGDNVRALEQLRVADKLSEGATLVRLELARVLQYERKFDEAAALLNAVEDLAVQPAKTRRIHADLLVQNELRRADFLLSSGQNSDALVSIVRARDIFNSLALGLVDWRTVRHVLKVRRTLAALKRIFHSTDSDSIVNTLSFWVREIEANLENGNYGVVPVESAEVGELVDSPVLAGAISGGEGDRRVGRLQNLHERFGFVECGAFGRFFFHRGEWESSRDYLELGSGCPVSFEIGANERGPCAVRVRPVAAATLRESLDLGSITNSGERLVGTVYSMEITFGFVETDNGERYFFHRNNMERETDFSSLQRGKKVSFMLGTNHKGVCADGVRLLA